MKDYSRRQWAEGGYKKMIKEHSARAIWNKVLEAFPGNSEFDSVSQTPIDRRLKKFIVQSEGKKPYLNDKGYRDMEDSWEGPGLGLSAPGGPAFDQPWNLENPGSAGLWVLQANATGNYCDDRVSTEKVFVFGTHPITEIEFSFPNLVQGISFSIVGGLGTTTVELEFSTSTDDSVPQVRMRAYLEAHDAPGGTQGVGWTDFSVTGKGCGPDECASPPPFSVGLNPATIAPLASVVISVVDGVSPYSWTKDVSDLKFFFDAPVTAGVTNELNATSDSCGTCGITVTDACDQEVSFDVLSTNGSWQNTFEGCIVPGPYMEGPGDGDLLFREFRRTEGGKRSTTKYHSCYYSDYQEGCGTTCNGYCSTGRCVEWEPDGCARMWGPGFTGSWPCCEEYQPWPVDIWVCLNVTATWTLGERWLC